MHGGSEMGVVIEKYCKDFLPPPRYLIWRQWCSYYGSGAVVIMSFGVMTCVIHMACVKCECNEVEWSCAALAVGTWVI